MHVFGGDAGKGGQQEARAVLVAGHILEIVVDHAAGRFDLLLQIVLEERHRREGHVLVVVVDRVVGAVLLRAQ